MLTQRPIAFLLDVDNTLLDNDRFAADLSARLEQKFGAAAKNRYWALYAQLRDELGYVDYLGTLGLPVVLSDGDVVFQPRKIERSGIWNAVAGRVLITLHKERRLGLVQRRFPASHYVMIDDKPQLLAAMKQVLGTRLTTVFVRQGHHAAESDRLAIDPAPDMTIAHIGDLCDLALTDFHAASRFADRSRRSSPTTASQERP